MAFQKVGGIDKFAEQFTGGEGVGEAEQKMVTDALVDLLLTKFGEAYFPLPVEAPVTVRNKGGIAGLLTTETERVYAAAKAEKDGTLAHAFRGKDKFAAAEDQSVLPFKIVKLEEKKPLKTTGTTWFDRDLGRPARVTKAASYEYALTVSSNGQEAEATLAEKTEVDIRFVAKMPPDDN